MLHPLIFLIIAFAVLALSREVIVAGTLLVVSILLAFAVARGAARHYRRAARARGQGLARAFADFLELRLSDDRLCEAARTADDATFWSTLESFAAHLDRARARRLATALRSDRHADTERLALRDDSPWRRELAARRLGLLLSAATRRALLESLEVGPEAVTYSAAMSLARGRDPNALRWILDHPQAFATRTREARVALLRAFGRRFLPDLAAALERGMPDAAMERALVETLWTAHDRAAASAIVRRLESADAELRVAAARALGRILAREHAAALIATLGDEVWTVRAQAARALGRLAATEAIPSLAAALTDRSWWVRRHAAYALRKLGPDGRAALRHTLEHSEDPYAREMAREAMEDSMRLRA